jgi:hypothetical protein
MAVAVNSSSRRRRREQRLCHCLWPGPWPHTSSSIVVVDMWRFPVAHTHTHTNEVPFRHGPKNSLSPVSSSKQYAVVLLLIHKRRVSSLFSTPFCYIIRLRFCSYELSTSLSFFVSSSIAPSGRPPANRPLGRGGKERKARRKSGN